MKGKFTSEVKHKIQKLLISDLKPEDQGRYTCQYQNLESSADLWVEGLYLEITLKPPRPAGCFGFTNLFHLLHQRVPLIFGDFPLFCLFLLGFVPL